MNGGATVPTNSPPTSAAATSLAPGFRFHPTDEELVIYYLKRKVSGRPLRVDAIAEVDLYKTEPWDLPGHSRLRSRDQEWYFFSPLDRKYSNRSRTNRATAKGYWKTTGKDRAVHHCGRVVGMKKTLVFHDGRPPRGKRTNWVMHEYRLEDEQLVGIPQDGYVVCRIFQKKGAGPMNGAQYGAPFVEEEWEDVANGSVMLPDGAQYESNDDEETEYLEFKDFLPSQDLGIHDSSSLFMEDPDEQNCINHRKEIDNLLEEMVQDSSFLTDMVDGNDEPGQQSSPTLTDDSGGRPFANDSYIFPNQHTEYLEHDPADTIDGHHPSIEDSVGYSLGACDSQSSLDGIGKSSNLHKILDVEEFFDTTNDYLDQPELLPICTVPDNLYLQQTDGNHSDQEIKSDSAFYDRPGYKVPFTEDSSFLMNATFYSSIAQESDFEMVDDLMAYFDATDANLHNDTVDYLEGSECLHQPNFSKEVNGDTWKTSNAATDSLDVNVGDGSSSSATSVASHQFKNKYKDFATRPGTSLNEGSYKTNPLVNILGAISAPPAIAAESVLVKSVGQMFTDHSSSPIQLTTGVIHVRGLTMSSNASHVSLKKNGDVGFLLSYSMADNLVRKSVVSGPVNKFQNAAVSIVLRGGFYLLFLSAIIISISYKAGICICGR